MIIMKPPQVLDLPPIPCVFLGGSIEMGTAVDWQAYITKALENQKICILNPRRDDWDSSWEQKITNPPFKEQVTWELDALARADIVVFYFDPATKSPIALLELGMFGRDRKTIVCCPEGYWRKGNVDIVCERLCIQTASTLDELVGMIIEKASVYD